MADLCVHRLKSAEEPLFAAAWALYESSFPPEEQRPRYWQERAMAECPEFHCMRLFDSAGAVGILFFWQAPEFIYIEHLAVENARRASGLGHRILDWVQSHYPELPVLLEADHVTDDISARRIRFYESCGYTCLPFVHAQLPFHAGGAPVPMMWLSYPVPAPAELVEQAEVYLRERVMRYRDI